MMPIAFPILLCLLYAGISCIVRRAKLGGLVPKDFPEVDQAIFAQWKQAERKRLAILLCTTWGALVLQIALQLLLRMLLPHMSRGDKAQLLDIVIFVELGYVVGSFCLMIVCGFGEGNEQKKLRVEARVKSFYHPSRRIEGGGKAISAEPFTARVNITHVLGTKRESGGFMSNRAVYTKSYQVSERLSLDPPAALSAALDLDNNSVYLTCPHCDEQLASYVSYAAYAKIPSAAIRGDSALKKKVERYILTHGLAPYWIFFLSAFFVAGFSAGAFLHGVSPFPMFAALFALLDIALFGMFVGAMVLYVNSSIRRRDTLLRFPALSREALDILQHVDIRPAISVCGVEIESARGDSHQLEMLNSTQKRSSWGSTSIRITAADYGNFGLHNPYIPEV